MKYSYLFSFNVITLVIFISIPVVAELSDDIQSSINKILPSLQKLSTDEKVVAFVKNYIAAPPEISVSMTNDKWKTLTLISPEVKAFAKNDLAQYLNATKAAYITEIFVSAPNGNKIAFLSKPSGWNHKGKPKHDLPMKGRIWIGDVEIDESIGQPQVQVAIPVFDGKIPIGSIVVGLNISELPK